MSEELQGVLLDILYAVVPVVGTVLVGYFGQKGWKGWVLRKIIEAVVDRVSENEVARMKAETEKQTGNYDLTPVQSRAAMYAAQRAVEQEVAKRDAELPAVLKPVLSVKNAVPPVVPLQLQIEEVVQERKLKRKADLNSPRRLGKGR